MKTDRTPQSTVCFAPADLELFGAASHDRNPLHLSPLHARNSPYGECVTFGILGGLACLARLDGRRHLRLDAVSLDFLHPIYPGIVYVIDVHESSAREARVRLSDGTRVVLKATLSFAGEDTLSAARAATEHQAASTPPIRVRPAAPGIEELVPGYSVGGVYAPSWTQLRRVARRVELNWDKIEPAQLAALLWGSYVVGMELPGERALFSRLSLTFEATGAPPHAPLAYQASVISFDERFALLRIGAELSVGGETLARGELRSFVRPDATDAALTNIGAETRGPLTSDLAGKVALIVGASRGLGAALALALARRGSTVFASFLLNRAEAEKLRNLPDISGRIVLLQGDAGCLEWCEEMREIIAREAGRLDYLVCNACPALRPLRVEPGAVRRINDYVAQSLALVSTPMSVFADDLAASGGRNVVISSSATQSVPAEWPHYVSAKCAIEGLTRAAAAGHERIRFLIVRPPKLLTDLTNTPLGRQDAISPSIVAESIVESLTETPRGGDVEMLDNFAAPTFSEPPAVTV